MQKSDVEGMAVNIKGRLIKKSVAQPVYLRYVSDAGTSMVCLRILVGGSFVVGQKKGT